MVGVRLQAEDNSQKLTKDLPNRDCSVQSPEHRGEEKPGTPDIEQRSSHPSHSPIDHPHAGDKVNETMSKSALVWNQGGEPPSTTFKDESSRVSRLFDAARRESAPQSTQVGQRRAPPRSTPHRTCARVWSRSQLLCRRNRKSVIASSSGGQRPCLLSRGREPQIALRSMPSLLRDSSRARSVTCFQTVEMSTWKQGNACLGLASEVELLVGVHDRVLRVRPGHRRVIERAQVGSKKQGRLLSATASVSPPKERGSLACLPRKLFHFIPCRCDDTSFEIPSRYRRNILVHLPYETTMQVGCVYQLTKSSRHFAGTKTSKSFTRAHVLTATGRRPESSLDPI